jgi:hypothetical protein
MDFNELTGKTLDEVKEIISHPYFLFISTNDGEVFNKIMYLNPNRVNIDVNNGIVTYLNNG